MPRFRPILITSIAFTVAAGAMWGVAVDWVLTGTALPLGGSAAATLTAVAAMCWMDLRRVTRYRHRAQRDADRARQDQDKALLIRTLADVVPARPLARVLRLARTIPMHRVL